MSKTLFIADKLSEDALRFLEDFSDIVVDYRPGLSVEEKIGAIRGASALIVRSATQVDAQLLAAADSLEVVVRAGVGVDNVDLAAATRKGIVVQNVPDGNTRSAAEHTIALILAMSRNVPQAQASLKDGKWERSRFVGVEVLDKSLGIVGLGKIGRHVASMAAGIGFKVLAFDPFLSPQMADELGVELIGDLGELASKSEFLTIHVPKTDSTRALIDADILARAKPGIRIVNCARGGIVDESALLAAIENGTVAGAAVDVFEVEPPEDRALIDHPAVVCTPHLGASTREAQENVALAASRMIVDYLRHRKLHAPVNTVVLDPDLRARVEPYGELARRLGRVHAQLLEGQPQRIVVKFFGDTLGDPKTQSFVTSAVLIGFLEGRSAQTPNWVNARTLAKEHGVAVEERTEGPSRYFANMLCVELHDSPGTRELGGAIRGLRGMRLVRLDSYHFDAVLEGTMLLTANEDRPGMIGALGQVLAANEINIASLSLGRDRKAGKAISVTNIDEPECADLDCEKLEKASEQLLGQDGILWVKAVEVG